jgi:hypothetical protein
MAEEVEYTDGPNDEGEMFQRPLVCRAALMLEGNWQTICHLLILMTKLLELEMVVVYLLIFL